jgi:hypothetical protein
VNRVLRSPPGEAVIHWRKATARVARHNRPDGNVTGVASMGIEIGGKQFGLLHELDITKRPGATSTHRPAARDLVAGFADFAVVGDRNIALGCGLIRRTARSARRPKRASGK